MTTKSAEATSRIAFPLELSPAEIVLDTDALVQIILRESDNQVVQKEEEVDGLDSSDFELSCDALNYWRVLWRCQEEWGENPETKAFAYWLLTSICSERDYHPEEFELALEATKDRVRVPYGLQPLEIAFRHMKKKPVRLLSEELKGKKLLAEIAGVAIHLQNFEFLPYILLPVDNIRQLFGCRKVAITGAILKLLEHGILKDTGAKYGVNRARQFNCTAELGKDYEFVGQEPK